MLVIYFVNFRWLNDHLFGRELIVRFAASAFRGLPSICVFGCFPFGFEGKIWDLIVSVPDHCFSFFTFHLVWAHMLEIFAVNRIPTSGSLEAWPLVFFIHQQNTPEFFDVCVRNQ